MAPNSPLTTPNRIPLLPVGVRADNDPAYIKALSDAIDSDGCSVVSEIYHPCCVVHDLGYRHGVDPYGQRITRRQTDANFRKCIQAESSLGRLSPTSWIRWLGVRVFGRFVYNPVVAE